MPEPETDSHDGYTYNLKLDSLAIELDCADFLVTSVIELQALPQQVPYEVNTNGGYVAFSVCVVGESKQQAGLSDSGISDEEQLEEVVVSEQKGLSNKQDNIGVIC